MSIVENLIQNPVTQFEKEFSFGAATAAFQIEGAWKEDGKGPSIWDQMTHDYPEKIVDRSNADIGPDSYHLYEEDIRALKETGVLNIVNMLVIYADKKKKNFFFQTKVNFYRFSISWSRILPDGDVASLNVNGIKYYNNLIDKLIENGIEPMVTMYHYDLPQNLQYLGGLMNPKIADYFKEYSNILFLHFGDRVTITTFSAFYEIVFNFFFLSLPMVKQVKRWITFNEPFDFCTAGYGQATNAPLVYMPGIGEYYCIDNVIQSHAKAYHLYQKLYKQKFGGKIGITLSSRFFYSTTNDTDTIDRAMQYQVILD